MLYRPFGRTGQQVSILGFGCMRLPFLDGRLDRIDEPLATEMLTYALDRGVNYIDTAYPYHTGPEPGAPGESEGFVGRVLAGGYREKVLLATKLPCWMAKSRADMEKIFAGQLERLGTDYVDCYLLHALGGAEFERMVSLGALEFLDDLKTQGRVRFTGFSFHDDPPTFAPIVDGYDWDMCQIQYNFMDVEYQAGTAGLAYAADKGLAVVVMEPLKGGRLAGRVPDPIKALWDTAPVERTPAEWALRFVWDDPRVSLLLSGMSAMDQVKENVALASEGHPGSLTAEELALIEKVRDEYRARTTVGCTECRYCLPCPQNINIPLVLSCLNAVSLYGDLAAEQKNYSLEAQAGRTAPASACVECGQCEDACPQKIEVINELARAVEVFGQ